MTSHGPVRSIAESVPYRFTQHDYLLLSEHGSFARLAKVELIDGALVALNAQFSRHVRVQSLLFRALADACDHADAEVSAWLEGSISIDDESMPQPDIFVATGLPEEGAVPIAAVKLVVEVADTSLKIDLGAKAILYAGARVPEYWVADVERRVIHQLWSPEGEVYRERREVPFGEPIVAETIGGLSVNSVNL